MTDVLPQSTDPDDDVHSDSPRIDSLDTSSIASYPGVPIQMFPFGVISQSPIRSKRRQVKNACTHCQKACKKCDDARPCLRCVKYGIGEECVDSQRKERKKGVKRGPYKKRDGKSECSPSLLLLLLLPVCVRPYAVCARIDDRWLKLIAQPPPPLSHRSTAPWPRASTCRPRRCILPALPPLLPVPTSPPSPTRPFTASIPPCRPTVPSPPRCLPTTLPIMSPSPTCLPTTPAVRSTSTLPTLRPSSTLPSSRPTALLTLPPTCSPIAPTCPWP
ncbi:hypothetical protein OF83DRAFT_1118218 [Amylostereum chailletii]|nr:hypothetical protein OF83DRAFT_1118218 [Amylostereum chailletii]